MTPAPLPISKAMLLCGRPTNNTTISAYLALRGESAIQCGRARARAKSLWTLDVTATKAAVHRSRRQTEILLKVASWQN